MKPGRSRRWTRIPELRALIDRAVAEPGSKLVAVAVGPCGQEQTLQRWVVTTVTEAHAWANGHLKAQAQSPVPVARFRWIRPGGERAGSVVCRLELPRAEGESRASPQEATAAAAATPDDRSALRQKLAAAEARARQAEARAEAAAAELQRANADCARLARERDTLTQRLQEATDANARKDALLADATRLAEIVSARFG